MSSLPETYLRNVFPHWLFWNRCLQIILSVVILAMDAYVISKRDLAPGGLVMFTVSLLFMSLEERCFLGLRGDHVVQHISLNVVIIC